MMHIEGRLAGNEAVRPLGIALYLNSGKLASMLSLRLGMWTSGIEKENLESDIDILANMQCIHNKKCSAYFMTL